MKESRNKNMDNILFPFTEVFGKELILVKLDKNLKEKIINVFDEEVKLFQNNNEIVLNNIDFTKAKDNALELLTYQTNKYCYNKFDSILEVEQLNIIGYTKENEKFVLNTSVHKDEKIDDMEKFLNNSLVEDFRTAFRYCLEGIKKKKKG